jgi:hypothetical protein
MMAGINKKNLRARHSFKAEGKATRGSMTSQSFSWSSEPPTAEQEALVVHQQHPKRVRLSFTDLFVL